jgi:hypothetical protein
LLCVLLLRLGEVSASAVAGRLLRSVNRDSARHVSGRFGAVNRRYFPYDPAPGGTAFQKGEETDKGSIADNPGTNADNSTTKDDEYI